MLKNPQKHRNRPTNDQEEPSNTGRHLSKGDKIEVGVIIVTTAGAAGAEVVHSTMVDQTMQVDWGSTFKTPGNHTVVVNAGIPYPNASLNPPVPPTNGVSSNPTFQPTFQPNTAYFIVDPKHVGPCLEGVPQQGTILGCTPSQLNVNHTIAVPIDGRFTLDSKYIAAFEGYKNLQGTPPQVVVRVMDSMVPTVQFVEGVLLTVGVTAGMLLFGKYSPEIFNFVGEHITSPIRKHIVDPLLRKTKIDKIIMGKILRY